MKENSIWCWNLGKTWKKNGSSLRPTFWNNRLQLYQHVYHPFKFQNYQGWGWNQAIFLGSPGTHAACTRIWGLVAKSERVKL
jgi:hypothetical protein